VDVIHELYTTLKNLGRTVYFNTGKTELNTRCPYCGDSIKDKTHAHLYIEVKEPHRYFCQRCDSRGILNSDTLKDIELDDIELGKFLDNNIKQFLKNTTKTRDSLILTKNKNYKIPKYEMSSSILLKQLDYFKERLGMELDRKILLERKVIGNFENFLYLNKIDYLLDNDKFYNLIKNIDKTAIGFLSSDSNYVIFRYLDKNAKKRYLNLSLNYPYNIGSKAYSIKSSIDIFEPEINLILSEGIFDINSVYNNFYKCNPNSKNTLFFAVNGKSYNQVPIMLNRLGFLSLNLHIYSDKDVSLYDYKNKLNLSRFNKVLVSYNIKENEKDFGVTMDRISRKTTILK
jgi:hypothetical protein